MPHTVRQDKTNRKKTKIKREKFSLRLPREMKRGLADLARREDEATIGTIARRAFREYLDNHPTAEAP